MDIHKASWIHARVPGYANKLTQEETIRYQSDETMAHQLDVVSNLTLDVVTSDEMQHRLTLHQAAEGEQEGEAAPNEAAPAAPKA